MVGVAGAEVGMDINVGIGNLIEIKLFLYIRFVIEFVLDFGVRLCMYD